MKILIPFLVILIFSSNVLASRTINSSTVDAASSTSVSSGATIRLSVTVTTTQNGNKRHWKSTAWRIAGSSGSLTCENHPNHNNSNGTFTEAFDITAPSTSGTNNLYLIAYKDDNCSSGASTEFVLSGAVAVSGRGGASSSSCGEIPSLYPLYSTSEIKLEKSISVNGNTVSNATKSPNAAINSSGNFSNNISQTLPVLNPSSFPSNAAEDHNHLSSSKTFDNTSETYYKDIKLQSTGISATFTGGGPFHIGELKTEKENNTINFAAGTYYIKKFKTQLKSVTINITSSPVIIHIGEEFKTEEENVSFNSSGSVDDFIVYLHSGAKVEFKKKNVNFTGLIYGPGNVEKVLFEEEDITFRGAIIVSGGTIETKKETNAFTYTTADQTAIGNISTCSTTNPTVHSLSTTDTTPILTGTFDSSNSTGGFTVTVNNITFTLTSSADLTNSGDSWTLNLSNISALSTGTYEVVASANDGAGTILSDTSSNELVITAVAACDTIPATYPLYNTTQIKLDANISVNNNQVSSATKSPNAAIDVNGNFSNNISQTLPNLDPSSFPSNTISDHNDIHNHLNSSTTYNNTTEVYYRDIKLQTAGISVSFTGGGPFHIDELKAEKENNTINFAAGTYYIKKFKTQKENVTINVTSSPVIVHIGEEFKTEKEGVDINKSGSVDDFIVYLHSGAKVEFKKENVDFTGVIYGPSNVEKVLFTKENNTFRGAIIISGGNIEVTKENNSFTYTTADKTAVGNIKLCLGGGSSDTAASSFNCVESGEDDEDGKLFTKTTAQSFSFYTVALQEDADGDGIPDGVETVFASGADHTVTVELVNAATSANCEDYPVLNPAVSQSLTFTASDLGKKATTTMTSGKAYKKVKCRVIDPTDNPSEPIKGCSTDSFTIRPTYFTDIAIKKDDLTPLTNASTTGDPKEKSGADFTIAVSATAGYNGTPSIDNTQIEAHLNAIQAGIISGSFSPADSDTGIATGSTFNYSEVGQLRFGTQAIIDDSFSNESKDIDNSDCTNNFSNTVDGNGKVGCKFGNTSNSDYFGRFIPDHFRITNSQNGNFSNACTGFTYTGQAFGYQSAPTLTITAYNGLSPATVTKNYTSSFASDHLAATDFNVSTPTIDTNQLGADASNLVNIEWTPDTATLLDNLDGSLTFSFGTDSFLYTHEDNSKIVPFDSTIDLKFSDITDDDGVKTKLKIEDASEPDEDNKWHDINVNRQYLIQTTGTSIRFGRINISNAHGSELTDLPVPLTAQYWNGSHWLLNTSDQCSTLTLSLSDPITDSLAITDLCAWDNGSPGTSGIGCSTTGSSSNKFNEPPLAKPLLTPPILTGDFNLNFKATGKTGALDVTATVEDYLQFNWKGNGNENPTARVTFGIYKSNSKQIYFREIY